MGCSQGGNVCAVADVAESESSDAKSIEESQQDRNIEHKCALEASTTPGGG